MCLLESLSWHFSLNLSGEQFKAPLEFLKMKPCHVSVPPWSLYSFDIVSFWKTKSYKLHKPRLKVYPEFLHKHWHSILDNFCKHFNSICSSNSYAFKGKIHKGKGTAPFISYKQINLLLILAIGLTKQPWITAHYRLSESILLKVIHIYWSKTKHCSCHRYWTETGKLDYLTFPCLAYCWYLKTS